ncbi:GNAT family N-acetyltransferase OS=Streptomyces microflavus OX=1919 GN=HUT09_11375 PE=4 SV=1 [Streptomyces microflavus]
MTSLARHQLSPAETGPALRALYEWTPADAPAGGLHPGDVGWLLRLDDAAVHLWTDGEVPVAVGFLDGPVLRVTAAPTPISGRSRPMPRSCSYPATTGPTACPYPGGCPSRRSPGSSCRGPRGRL